MPDELIPAEPTPEELAAEEAARLDRMIQEAAEAEIRIVAARLDLQAANEVAWALTQAGVE